MILIKIGARNTFTKGSQPLF